MTAPVLVREFAPLQARFRGAKKWPEMRLSPGAAVCFLLGICLAAFALYISDPRTLPVRHVLINGEFLHLAPDVLQRAAEKVVRGGFFNVNVETVREEILREPWVHSVSVRRVWPDSLSVYVIEQRPMAIWKSGGLLNEGGRIFNPAAGSLPGELPLLGGPRGTERLMLERFQFIDGIFADAGLRLAELQLSDRRAWSFKVAGGPEVILGRRHFIERVRRAVLALGTTLNDKVAVIARLDMRYTNGYAVRWSDPPAGEVTEEARNNG